MFQEYQNYLPIKKICEIFGGPHLKSQILSLEKEGLIPASHKMRVGAVYKKAWRVEDLGEIGAHLGFFPPFNRRVSLSVFTTKGGVLKTFMALNIARVAALHNIKTCVVGLDIQGDITRALGFEPEVNGEDDLGKMLSKLDHVKGIADVYNGQVRLNDLIVPTDLPNLFLIPETPELVAFNESLGNINRREYWIKEKVVDPLKEYFDLVIMDCSPNWNKLTTNALVASDVLISPLECKINNFRNFKVFSHFLGEFQNDMQLNFEKIFIPTRYSVNRKLSLEIKEWYQQNVSGCVTNGVRESVFGEESVALNRSLIEHAPKHGVANEMRELMKEINSRISGCSIIPHKLLRKTDEVQYQQDMH